RRRALPSRSARPRHRLHPRAPAGGVPRSDRRVRADVPRAGGLKAGSRSPLSLISFGLKILDRSMQTICPLPDKWNRIYEALVRAWDSGGRIGDPPPVPLILNG